MASTAPLVTSGEGHQAFLSMLSPDYLTARLITGNILQTRWIGQMFPRGVWHCGEAGLANWSDDTSGALRPLIVFRRFIHEENEVWFVPSSAGPRPSAGSLWWRWLPGVTVELTVFY